MSLILDFLGEIDRLYLKYFENRPGEINIPISGGLGLTTQHLPKTFLFGVWFIGLKSISNDKSGVKKSMWISYMSR